MFIFFEERSVCSNNPIAVLDNANHSFPRIASLWIRSNCWMPYLTCIGHNLVSLAAAILLSIITNIGCRSGKSYLWSDARQPRRRHGTPLFTHAISAHTYTWYSLYVYFYVFTAWRLHSAWQLKRFVHVSRFSGRLSISPPLLLLPRQGKYLTSEIFLTRL